MANLAVWVTGASLTQVVAFNDSLYLVGFCQVDGSAFTYGWGAATFLSDPPETLVDACINAAIAVVTGHGFTVGSGDVKTIVGAPQRTDDDSAFATTTAMTAAIATAGSGYAAVPGASSTVSLTSGTARQPSTTRPVLATVAGAWSWNITVLSTVTGSLTFKSDAAATPTTTLYAPAWSRGITVGVSVADTGTMPVMWSYVVPPSHFYSVTSAGGATFSIREQVL